MSKDYCDNELHCCNTCNCYGDTPYPLGNPSFSFLLILFLFFGGGINPASFFGPSNNIYRCSGFNNGWCNDFNLNNAPGGFSNTNNFLGNNSPATNFSGLLNSSF